MSGVGSSPALATCETSQVLLAGARCQVFFFFSRGSPVFAPPNEWPVSYELKKKKKKKKKKNSGSFRHKQKVVVQRRTPNREVPGSIPTGGTVLCP